MFLHVISAKYIRDFQIEVTFSNNTTGIADLRDTLSGPIFEPLKEISFFQKFRIDETLDTVVWPNGADIAPEYLYFKAFKDNPELQDTFIKWGYLET